MSDQPFRFLHSADFQLDQPLYGLTEIPEHLRDVLIDGTYRAAQRVFDTAVSEKVAFVCLSGNLLNLLVPTARSLSFLHEQFERLADLGIAVYWTGGHHDNPRHWPASIPLPDSVHHFEAADGAARTHEDASGLVVQILGHGHAGQLPVTEWATPASGQFTVAVVTGATDTRLLAARGVNYWALGGQDDRKTLFTEPNIAHYPGTPQGRSPSNIGPHGCTLVEVRSLQEARLRFVPCDVVRWQHERLLVSAAATWDDLQELLSQRVQEMRSQTPTLPLFVRWTLAAADGAVDADVVRGMAGRAMGWLKKQFGYQAEPCWPVSVSADVQQQIQPSSYEEDTLLGDYLRAVRRLQDEQQLSILQPLRVPDELRDDLQWLADLSDAATRSQVLRDATVLGAALLRGEKAI